MSKLILLAAFGAVILTFFELWVAAGETPIGPSVLPQESPKQPPKPATARGPALQGRIADEAGRPLRGAKIILYGGMATRWKIADAETDAQGGLAPQGNRRAR